MIQFDKFTLENGLRVIFHKDVTTPLGAVNVLYDVGARDEDPNRTGFAHLFEHLMFGGSVNIPDFDTPLQIAGGENNAFTSNDITNYYDIVPAENIDTALWLESDRMLSLAFTPKSLEVQRAVVIEEFKQRYLNQPYGDVWLELRPLAYKTHPYQWATIGKNIEHIEEATMDDVKAFFKAHYHPGNAILCIAGNFELEKIIEKVNHWFGSIPAQKMATRKLPIEIEQNEYRQKTLERNVPSDAFYFAFKMPERRSSDYYVADIISDLLGRDKSARLYVKLKKELGLVQDINAYVTGSLDQGLLMISGKLNEGKTFEELESSLWDLIREFLAQGITDFELERVMNKIRTSKAFEEQGILNKAMNLCYFELLGDADLINSETDNYRKVNAESIHSLAQNILRKENCSLLKVKAI